MARWVGGQYLPVVGDFVGVQQALQQDLIDPVSTYLVNHDPTTDPTGFVNELQGLSVVSPASVANSTNGQVSTFSQLPGHRGNQHIHPQPG